MAVTLVGLLHVSSAVGVKLVPVLQKCRLEVQNSSSGFKTSVYRCNLLPRLQNQNQTQIQSSLQLSFSAELSLTPM